VYTPGPSGSLVLEGHLLTTGTGTYNLGSSNHPWGSIYGSIATLYMGPTAQFGADQNGIAYTTLGFATPFINIGPARDVLDPGAIGGWEVGPTGTLGEADYDLVAQEKLSNVGLTGPIYSLIKTPTTICATARSISSQTLAANISENLQHDVFDFAYGITGATGATGYFQVPSAGVYKIIPSLQLNATGNGNIHVWLKVNNENVANTTTYLTFKNNEKQVFTTEILLELNASDQVQIWAQASVSGGVIEYIGAGGGTGANAYPAAPGIITNMYKLR
jgi:hypothetical protein